MTANLIQEMINHLRKHGDTILCRYDETAQVFLVRLEKKGGGRQSGPQMCSTQFTFEDKDVRFLEDWVRMLRIEQEQRIAAGVNNSAQVGLLERYSKSKAKDA